MENTPAETPQNDVQQTPQIPPQTTPQQQVVPQLNAPQQQSPFRQYPQIPIAPPPRKISKTAKLVYKLLIIIGALIVFQIPLALVNTLTEERQNNANNVQNEIADAWGKEQTIQLLAPANNEQINAEITPELRYRGIYQAVVYTAKVKIDAEYKNLPAALQGGIKVSDLTAVSSATLTINGKETEIDDNLQFTIPQGNSKCEITLCLRGSKKLLLTPSSKASRLNISGTWDSPGFVGNALPENRSIEDGKFSAEWNLGKFNKDVESVGVDLCITAGTYQQVERCFTYATFFLIIFFFTLLAAELITKVNIHILQYLVAAGAPVLFYLMTLALAEKIGFTAGYAVSAVVIVAMVTMYAKMFIGKTVPALVMGAVFAASYLINFMILRMEDLALLTGTIILAIVLAMVMLLTGKINRNQDPAQ